MKNLFFISSLACVAWMAIFGFLYKATHTSFFYYAMIFAGIGIVIFIVCDAVKEYKAGK